MFAGLFIVSGVIGQFIFSIPFTLIFLLFASLFVALAILPLLASVFLKRRSATKFEQKQAAYAHQLESWYRAKLEPFLVDEQRQYRFLSLIFAALVFSLSLPVSLFGGLVAAPLVYAGLLQTYKWQHSRNWANWLRTVVWVPMVLLIVTASFFVTGLILPTINPVQVTFFEQSDVDFLDLTIENPEGTVKEVTDVDTRRVEEILYRQTDIESFTVTVGGSNEKFANIFISLRADRSENSTEILERLRSELSVIRDVKVSVDQPSDGPPTGAAIIVKFLGDDLDQITSLANQSADIFRSLPDAVNVETSTNNNNTEFVLVLDKARATALGISPFQVSQVARTAIFGTDATSLTTLTEDIDVAVKLNINNSDDVTSATANVTSIDALERITIPSASGPIPLATLVDVELRESSSVINHESGQRVVTVTADASANGNARELQATAVERIRAELDIPDDVTISTGGGEAEESNQGFTELLLALVVGVLLMLGVLTLQFNSYLHTRYVLSILPYSLIGIFAGLALTMNPLSFPSIMGFIALSGIVVNNSILLIDMMNQLRKKDPTRDIKEVVLDAASSRLRPILLTTITTVIGMIPLTYAGDLWAPLAYAVMFGLVFSVIITLVLIPVIYLRKPGKVQR
jgi:HAE1 family hydrophobic/amphiphilic exporter-1